MRRTKFSVGRKWLCKRENPTNIKPDFYFVITGPGQDKNHVKCDLEAIPPEMQKAYSGVDKDREFSKSHIKTHGVLVEDDNE